MWYTPLCIVREVSEAPKTTQANAIALDRPPELDGKILLLKTSYTWVAEHIQAITELEAPSLLGSFQRCCAHCWERKTISSLTHWWTLHAMVDLEGKLCPHGQ